MKRIYIIIGVVLTLLSCGNGQGGKINRPYDGGHGIGIDTQTVNEIKRYEDSIKVNTPAEEKPKSQSSGSSYSSSRSSKKHHYDNMRGFDPASEDDMDDNGMDRYMENNDEGGWY